MKSTFRARDLIYCSLFAALIAVGAFIRIPVPMIPVTLQFFFTNLAGLLLGAKRGAISVAVYVALGLLGLPVFTAGGGIGYVFQPTFGYLLGFIAGTWVTGAIASKPSPTTGRLLTACLCGLATVYVFGLPYYWAIMTFYIGSGIGLWELVLTGFLVSAPGDVVFCLLSSVLGKRMLPILKRQMAVGV